jgi:hypothetical protein
MPTIFKSVDRLALNEITDKVHVFRRLMRNGGSGFNV